MAERQPVYKIFSIKRRYQQSKSWFPTFREVYTCGRQGGLPSKEWLFYRFWLV